MFTVPDHERAKKNVRVYKELLRGRSSHTKSRTVTNKRSYTVLAEKVHQKKFEMLCQGKYKVLWYDCMDFGKRSDINCPWHRVWLNNS